VVPIGTGFTLKNWVFGGMGVWSVIRATPGVAKLATVPTRTADKPRPRKRFNMVIFLLGKK